MSRFAPALRRVARELDVPRAVRAAILLELAADLESAYEHHIGRGCDEAEATRRAEAEVLGSSEVIRRLGRLHGASWRGWSEEVGSRLTGGLDLVLLVVAVLPVLLLAGGVSALSLAERPTPVAWLLAAVAVGVGVVVVSEAARLLRGRYADTGLLPLLLVLSALAPTLGGLALARGLYDAATELGAGSGAASSGVATAESGAPGAPGAPAAPASLLVLARVLARDGSALLAGLLLGLAGLLSWFVLLNRRTQGAAREVDRLLEEPAAAPAAGLPRPGVLPLARRRRG